MSATNTTPVATNALNIHLKHKMYNDIKNVQPFDSFTAVYKILVWAGYSQLLNKQASRLKQISHQIYRYLVLFGMVVYNVQHLIFTIQQPYDNMDKLMDCLVIEIPQINMLAKFFAMLIQASRINEINELLKGPIFASTDDQDALILQKNTIVMHRLSHALSISVTLSALLWPSSYFFKRYSDDTEVVPSYVPFKTDTWAKFSLSVFLETGPVLWTGYGHIALDCLIATYYAQAQIQLKMIKHQLRELHTKVTDNYDNKAYLKYDFQYKYLTDHTIFKRFVQIVKRYEKLVWYKNEVDAVFNLALSIQFFTSASVVCLVIYRITIIEVASLSFLFMVLLFCFLLTQVFMYCYYGNLVEFESQSVNECLYQSDWLSLSPSFRRSLLIAMCRWSRPLKPRVSGIIPLSLNTFISIVKSSYTLYTVLVITANQINV